MAGKGGNKVHCNVAGMFNSSIDGLPHQGVAIFKDAADKALEFCEKLREAMAPYEPGQIHFDNIDVSNTQWPLMTFSILLDVLQEKAASTKRLKAFKAGLDDECINCIATWLEHLAPQSLPSEIHLSHNQITPRGFHMLIDSLEGKRAQLPRKAAPVWLRVENNQVDIARDGAVVKPLVDAGRIVHMTKIGDRVPSAAAVAMPDFKNLKPLSGGGQAQQVAPARMALPAGPAPGYAGAQGNPWGGVSWGNGAGGYSPYGAQGAWLGAPQWNHGASWGGASQWQQQLVPQTQQPAVIYPPSWQAATATIAPARAATATIAPARGSAAAAAGGGRAGQAGTAADRSRTPAHKQSTGPKLPSGWEEQWSEEYQIPYYWHTETGESLWEPPEE